MKLKEYIINVLEAVNKDQISRVSFTVGLNEDGETIDRDSPNRVTFSVKHKDNEKNKNL